MVWDLNLAGASTIGAERMMVDVEVSRKSVQYVAKGSAQSYNTLRRAAILHQQVMLR